MKNVNRCIKMSLDAYDDSKSEQVGNEAYIVKKIKNKIYIAFRGSDDLEDWLENAEIGVKNQNGVLVHSGFYDAMRECIIPLRRFMVSNYELGDKIILTGHSKGGAMGLLYANDLVTTGYPHRDISFLGFGTPRVFKESILDILNKRRAHITLCEIESDPVTKLPREYMGYTKVYDIKKVKGVVWWRKIFGVRAYNHKMGEYEKKFKVNDKLKVFRFKTIRAKLGVRG